MVYPMQLGPGFFIAGGLCSSLSHVMATPIDVVKTSQQAEEERRPGDPTTWIFKPNKE